MAKKTFKILVNLSTQVMNIKNVLRRSNHKKQFKIYKNDYLIYINYLRCSDHTRQLKVKHKISLKLPVTCL